MLQKGQGCAEVALAESVAFQAVYTRKALLNEGSIDALRAVQGRAAQLDEGRLACVRQSCRARLTMDSEASCARSSGLALSSHICMACVLVKDISGGFRARWVS